MKNNKGFTIVELLVSFTLSMILVIIMFQLIINLKDLYVVSGLKTELLNKQYIITNKIYTDLTENKLLGISKCPEKEECINFAFIDGTTKTLNIDINNNKLSYDNYVIELKNDSYYGEGTISTTGYTTGEGNNRILTIDIPIYNSRFKDTNFGIRIVYPYNNSEVADSYGYKYIPPTDSYISLPYIKSNGNQYINLGYKAKTNTEIRLDIEFVENANTNLDNMDGYSNIIGKEQNTVNDMFNINFGGRNTQQKIIYYWIDKDYVPGTSIIYNKTYDSVTNRSTMIVKSGSATFQGETVTIDVKTANNVDNLTLLGSYRTDSNAIQAFTRYDTKVYGFQIYEGDTLVMNLTPAKSRETNTIGLYDTISKNFYTSDGTNGFIYE